MAFGFHPRFAVLLISALVLFSVFAVAAIIRVVPSNEMRQLQEELRAIRQRGEPVEPKELLARCPIFDSERLRAAEWMRLATLAEPAGKFTDDAKPLPFVGELEVKDDALDDEAAHELREKARRFLSKHQTPLLLAHQLSKSPGPVAFPYKHDEGFESLFPWVQSLRALNRLLAMECRLRAVEGDIEGSLASWRTMLALSDALRARSCDVSIAVVEAIRHSMLRLAIEQVQFHINHPALTDAHLQTIQDRFAEIKPEDELRSVMFGERLIALVAFQHPEQIFGDDLPKRSPTTNLSIHAKDCRFFLLTMHELIETCQMPYPDCRRKAKAILDSALEKAKPVDPTDVGPYPGSAILLPGTVVFGIEGAAPTIAFRNIALTAVAARRFAIATGHFPSAMDDLVPHYLDATLLDPYSGKPLIMKNSEKSLKIYSVDKNEADDGGLNDPSDGDIAWILHTTEK